LILVQPTRPAEPGPYIMFNLLCYVRGDDHKHAFIVKIEEEEAVATLKEAIKAKKTQTFCNIDADSLVIWNASVSFNRALKENVEALNLVDDDSLQPPEILSDLFPSGLEKKSVHIIVDRPPPGESQPPTSPMHPHECGSYQPVLFPQTALLRERRAL
jgi:Crinkler effector protein N-terminal domain